MGFLFRFMLVNLKEHRVISSVQPHLPEDVTSMSQIKQLPNGQLNIARKLDILRTFYRNTVAVLLADSFVPSPHGLDENGGVGFDLRKKITAIVLLNFVRDENLI